METGTIEELNLKPRDVVEFITTLHYCTNYNAFIPGKHYTVEQDGMFRGENGNILTGNGAVWRIVSRAPDDTPKLWRDMTDAEKGALLLAHHEGKVIEVNTGHEWHDTTPVFTDSVAYRVKPEPVRETVTIDDKTYSFKAMRGHRITFDLIDGEPDVDSIKMEAIK